jgi:hypothetical protein
MQDAIAVADKTFRNDLALCLIVPVDSVGPSTAESTISQEIVFQVYAVPAVGSPAPRER